MQLSTPSRMKAPCWSALAFILSLSVIVCRVGGKLPHHISGELPSCSSLDGPYCLMINAKRAPLHSNGASKSSHALGFSSSTSTTLSTFLKDDMKNTLEKSLEKSMKQLAELSSQLAGELTTNLGKALDDLDDVESPFHVGWFELEGKVVASAVDSSSPSFSSSSSNVMHLALLPNESWRVQPGKDWITVGLVGTVRENSDHTFILEADLVDHDGKKLDECSQLVARRVKALDNLAFFVLGADGGGVKNVNKMQKLLPGSTWKGMYKCGNQPTELTLALESSSRKEQQAESSDMLIRGDFMFLVRRHPDADVFHDLSSKANNYSPAKRTLAECECMFAWEDKRKTTFYKGVCASKPDEPGKKYCKINPKTCKKKPKHHQWDYCS